MARAFESQTSPTRRFTFAKDSTMNDGPTICKECGSPITQLGGGHRGREYCDDNCKQAAYRARQEEKRKVEVRQRWTGYSEQTQNQLEWLMNKYGCDFAKMVAGLICTE